MKLVNTNRQRHSYNLDEQDMWYAPRYIIPLKVGCLRVLVYLAICDSARWPLSLFCSRGAPPSELLSLSRSEMAPRPTQIRENLAQGLGLRVYGLGCRE
jgi:hypothetical protein